jgi:hypothetical protein
MSDKQEDIRHEGHTREWQDRARVILDAKKEAQKDSADKQSPAPGEEGDKDESNSKEGRQAASGDDDPVY